MTARQRTLTPTEARCLDLVEYRAHVIGSLAWELDLTISQARRLVGRLERRGLIKSEDGWISRREA